MRMVMRVCQNRVELLEMLPPYVGLIMGIGLFGHIWGIGRPTSS